VLVTGTRRNAAFADGLALCVKIAIPLHPTPDLTGDGRRSQATLLI
jgi:hypothetical protein